MMSSAWAAGTDIPLVVAGVDVALNSFPALKEVGIGADLGACAEMA